MLAYDCHECGNPVPACEARMRSQAFAQVAFHAACLVAHTTRHDFAQIVAGLDDFAESPDSHGGSA